MCGLVGVAGKLEFKDEFLMQRLLLADYFRGPDSTGLAAIRKDGSAKIAKINSNPIDLFNMKNFCAALNGSQSEAFIGHNRFATRGVVNTVNAHPFTYGSVTGAHNGTLCKDSVKALETKLGEEFAVDSMALIAGIDRLGIKKTIELCYHGKTNTEGAWAIVWHDAKDGTINFLRNEHRPLYFAWEAPKEEGELGFKRIFWASEYWMIREAIAASTGGYKIHTEQKGETNVGFFHFPVDTHYKFKLADLVEGSKTRPKPTVKTIKGREVPVTSVVPFDLKERNGNGTWPRKTHGTHGGGATSQKSHQNKGGSSSTSQNTTTQSASKRKFVMMETSGVPYAGLITETQFVNDFGAQCFWCKKPVVYGDVGLTFIDRDKSILCSGPNCSNLVEKSVPRLYVRGPIIDALVE